MKNKFLVLLIISVISLFLSSFVASALLPNYPAYWDTLENKNINENTKNTVLIYQNIKSKCHDPDDPIRIFNIASVHNHYKLSISKNNLYLTDLEPNYDKTERVILNCNGVYGSFNLIINPVNDAPIISNLPDLNINEDTNSPVNWIDLHAYTIDIDNTNEELTFSINSQSNPSLINCYITNNKYINCDTPVLNQNGLSDITIEVSDDEYTSEDSFTLTILPVDDPAVWETLSNKAIPEDSADNIIVYSGLLSQCSDVDNLINMQVNLNPHYDLSFSGNDLVISNLEQNYNGIETVYLNCNGIPNSFILTISPINDAPILTTIESKTINENQLLTFIISGNDIDSPSLIYSATNLPQGAIFDINTKTFSWTPTYEQSGTYTVSFGVSDSSLIDTKQITITVNNINRAPIWNIIPQNQIILEGTSLSYQISATDPDNDIITYSVNDQEFLISPNGLLTWTPELNWNGYKEITITASDGINSIISTIRITVSPVNQAPIVSDIPSQTIDEGSLFTTINLDNYVTDIDNSIGEIIWTYSGNSELIIDITNRIATITTPNINWYGSETIIFRAKDPEGLFSEDSVTFTVNPVNDAPIIDSYIPIQDQTIQEGNSQEFIIQASDVDNDDLTIKWYVDDIEVGIGNSYTFNADYSSSDNSPYEIRVVVTDENNEYVSHDWALTVLDTNRAPISYNIDNIITQEDTPIEINLNCEDSDNDILSYEIVNDVNHGSAIINNNIVTYTPEKDYNGQDSFSYRCSDGKDFSNNAVVNINVNSENDPAVWETLSNKAIPEDSTDTIIYQDLKSKCTDIDSPINMQITSAHNNYDLSFSGNDLVINNLEPNYNGIETVNLDCNGISNSFILTINPINDSPDIINEELLTQTVNEYYGTWTFDLTPFESDTEDSGTDLTWSISGVDENYIHAEITDVNEDILTLSTIPNVFCEEECGFTVTLTDSDGARDREGFNIYILPVNDAPIANNIISNTNENTEIILTLDYSDIDINDKAEICNILSITDGTISQPCTCNNGICTVGLIPLTNSDADILANYIVNDGDSDSNIATVTISVNSVNQAPIVSDIPSQTIDEGSLFTTINLDAYLTELDEDNVIWSHAGETDLIVNVDINNVVTITAPIGWAGSETITFTATDDNSEALFDSEDATFTVNLLPINNPPTITSTPATNAMTNQEYLYDVEATDSEGDIITYSLIKAPTGMTIDSNTGIIKWTPKNKGNYEVIVKISDDENNYITQTFTIDVDALYSKKHMFAVSSVNLPSETYQPSDNINGFILLRNLGHLKEKGISGKVSIPALGIVEQIPQTTLGVYDNKWVPFEIRLPDNIQDGEYLIKIELKNSKYTATKFSTFMIKNT